MHAVGCRASATCGTEASGGGQQRPPTRRDGSIRRRPRASPPGEHASGLSRRRSRQAGRSRRRAGEICQLMVINDTGNCQGDPACSPVTTVSGERSLDPARHSWRGKPRDLPVPAVPTGPPSSSVAGRTARGDVRDVAARVASACARTTHSRSSPGSCWSAARRPPSTPSSSSPCGAYGYLPAHVVATVASSILANELHRRLTFHAGRAGQLADRPGRGRRRLARGAASATSAALGWLDAAAGSAPPDPADHPRRRGDRGHRPASGSWPCAGSSAPPLLAPA